MQANLVAARDLSFCVYDRLEAFEPLPGTFTAQIGGVRWLGAVASERQPCGRLSDSSANGSPCGSTVVSRGLTAPEMSPSRAEHGFRLVTSARENEACDADRSAARRDLQGLCTSNKLPS